MAPSLRSSAQSTPTKASNTDTPNSTPRKTHHCTKCNRPKAGHPRQGCPYVDTSLSTDNPQEQENITNALGSMVIASPVRDTNENTKATVRNRRRSSVKSGVPLTETLASLSTNSSEIVTRLMQPGMFDNEPIADQQPKKNAVVRWQETVVAAPSKSQGKNKAFSRSPMPGTLNTPSPESSYQSVQGAYHKEDSSVPITDAAVSMQLAGSTAGTPKPLARSMSEEERDLFINELNHASKATVYVLPKVDIPIIQPSAAELGFHSRVAMNQDKHDLDGLLIVGRDEETVQTLFEKVESASKRAAVKHSNGRGGKLQAVAGGAVVGAVATFTGLAFA